ELHGDRRFADDKAMPCGLAKLDQRRCVVVTNQKGRNTKENVMRNFGCAHPEGYRKALRIMRLAQKFNLPIIALIDTPGAYAGIGSEERHIAEALAVNLRQMTLRRVAHRDHEKSAAVLGEALRHNLERLLATPLEQLLETRYAKFRRLGNFAELPADGATA